MCSHFDKIPSPSYQKSVIQEIYDMMSQRPNALALTDGDLEWTYDDLRRRSDTVARSLASHRINRGSVVGMHLPRCADAIATMLGIMISGCIYLPLDPSYPSGRLQFMLNQAGAVAIISSDGDPELYGSHRIWLSPPSQLATEFEGQVSEPPAYSGDRVALEPQDCAYILFTSGSTGDPKGVMVTHKNITLMNEWSAKYLDFTSFDASATTCSLSFDASFHETLLPLSVGGTVHVIPHALALGQLRRPVSLVATTLTVASELLRVGQLPPLKVLMLGGEALSPDVATRLLESGRVRNLLNCYGPTECTVCVTAAEVTAPVPDTVPIGLPVPGTEVLILDENGERLPDGLVGEICVFGDQVSLGYVNDAAETTKRFAIAPGTTTRSQRYYRTGDLGYRADDGMLYFIGRADRQVKINGVRIELEEIETALRSHPQISEAASIVQSDGRLVAYVVPAKEEVNIDIPDVRRFLARSLPRFMLPAGIVALAELPKTVNGKLDTSALPEWLPGRPEQETLADDFDEFTAQVIQIVADVTGFTGQIRPADDFVEDLGATSLDILRVLVELERYSSRQVRISDALADTSVAGLASLLHDEAVSPPADFAFNTDGDAPPLFLIHAYLGGMLGLRRLAELLPKDQPVYGLQSYNNVEQADDDLTISSLAQNTINRIREIQPCGQIRIAGHSAGGLIAFEAARLLRESGYAEPLVMLMDAPRPYNAFGYQCGELVLHWRKMISNPVEKFQKVTVKVLEAAHLGNSRTQGAAAADDLMSLSEKRSRSIGTAIKHWKTQSYNGSITVMRTRQGRMMAMGRPSLGWASVTQGSLTIVDVPGRHIDMLAMPHLDIVAEELTRWLSRG